MIIMMMMTTKDRTALSATLHATPEWSRTRTVHNTWSDTSCSIYFDLTRLLAADVTSSTTHTSMASN